MMAKENPNKRQLKFTSLDEMVKEAEMLLEKGYEPQGNWNLSQVCGHVADWMRFPMDGFPKLPWFMRPIFFVMKYTVANGMKKKILAEGFKGGMPTSPETVPTADAKSDREAVALLRQMVDRVKGHAGPLIPSPLFGEMDQAMHERVSLLHGAHHLGYLTPKS